MSFITVKKDEKILADYTNNYINESGMYDVILKNICVSKTKSGATGLDFYIEYNDQPQMLYQVLYLYKSDGTVNEHDFNLFMKLCTILGFKEGFDIREPVNAVLPIAKDGESKECEILPDFIDMKVTIRIQLEYSLYNDKINERKRVRNFFSSSDKASASELISEVKTVGEQYKKELKNASINTYKDDLTEEDILNWKNNNYTKNMTISSNEKIENSSLDDFNF